MYVLLFLVTSGLGARVTTHTGVYEGLASISYSGWPFYSFLGIKYATPVRYKPSVPVPDSSSLIEAKTPGPACLQSVQGSLYGQEDCLYMNLYTPKLNGSLPVMVFIHGGAYESGEAFTGPDFFMETQRVVYIFIQYRLGVLGFLDFNSEKYPSNLGLKDMVEALSWIKRNIRAFGGDPDRVTIEGESSGSVSVHLLMLSPLTKGLFRSAIGESGVGCAPWAIMPKPASRSTLNTLAGLAGCPSSSLAPGLEPADGVAECLANLTSRDIISATIKLGKLKPLAYMPYEPVLESDSSKDVFISAYPWAGPVHQIPWITGVNSFEGLGLMESFGFSDEFILALLDQGLLQEALPEIIQYSDSASSPARVTQQIEQFYQKGDPLDDDNFIHFLDEVLTDGMFVYPKHECLGLHLNSSAWSYIFGYLQDNERNSSGVKHAEELEYLFITDDYNIRINGTERDAAVSRQLIDLFVSFAENGFPSSGNISWEEYKPETRRVLLIDNNGFNMSPELRTQQINFWKSLPFRNKL